nr:type II and III secretion system protein [Desulfobulbaceae bacterium]
MTVVFSGGCASVPSPSPEESAAKFIEEQTKGAVDGSVTVASPAASEGQQGQLPMRYQKLSYNLGTQSSNNELETDTIIVGSSFPASTVSLRSILPKLTNLKNLTISWESDVNKDALVHVPNIVPDEDFFMVIKNILRQYDYSYEVVGRTLIVKHKETKNFHISMPFMSSTFSTSIGGDVLGSTQGANMSGTLEISSQNNAFDIWGNIQTNLDKILEIWSTPATAAPVASSTDSAADSAATTTAPRTAIAAVASPPGGRGYYTIDKPIGLISVTAPASLLEKIESYLENLKTELYKQVSIEAKIIEVTFTNNDTTGMDWASLFTTSFDFAMSFSKMNFIKSSATAQNSFITVGDETFTAVLDLMKKQGRVEVLSNPKITVMNGQPAMISVGENVTYIDSVSSTTSDGVISYSINTATVMSGLGLGVIASITDGNEVILNLTPVTSSLSEAIEYKTFGTNQVGLPKVNLRELSTIVRVKNGEMLIIGGLIDNSSSYNNDYVAGLGELPVAGQAFRTDGTTTSKKELIILLRPRITSL